MVRKDYKCPKCGYFETDGDIAKCPECGSNVLKVFLQAPAFGKHTDMDKMFYKVMDEQGVTNFNPNPSTNHTLEQVNTSAYWKKPDNMSKGYAASQPAVSYQNNIIQPNHISQSQLTPIMSNKK